MEQPADNIQDPEAERQTIPADPATIFDRCVDLVDAVFNIPTNGAQVVELSSLRDVQQESASGGQIEGLAAEATGGKVISFERPSKPRR